MGQAKDFVVAIFSPTRDAISETFIKAHIDQLPFHVVPYFGDGIGITDAKGHPLWHGGKWLKIWAKKYYPKLDQWLTERLISYQLRRVKADAVLAEYGVTGSWVGPACERAKIPMFVHFHGFDASEYETLESNRKSYERFFKSAAGIVAVSKAMYTTLIELGASADRLHLSACGVDPSWFPEGTPEKNTPNFIAVGRFVEKKAPYMTVLAFSHVVKTIPSAKLTMIGDGGLLGPCKRLAQGLGIENSIEFLGFLSHERVSQYMRQARAFVQHSLVAESGDSEGTPVSVVEAQMTGIPVIATRHAGIPDVVVDGETGLLVDEADVSGMAKAMIRIAENPELAGRMGLKGRERALQHFTIERHLGELSRMIKEGITHIE